MVKLINDGIIMNDQFLNKLNKAIEQVIKEKEELNIDYGLLEKILKEMIVNRKDKNTENRRNIVMIEKKKMISIMLNFFESVDKELYEKVIKILLQQDNNTKMNIYNVHEVKNFENEDENDIEEYTPDANVITRNGKSTIHIPTNLELRHKENKAVNYNDMCTLDDLFNIVHEISHLLDLNQEESLPTNEEIKGKSRKARRIFTRELLGESTAIAFEGMLAEYLIKNKLYTQTAVKEQMIRRINSSFRDAQIVYAKLLLAREKTTNKDITKEYIEKVMKENNLSVQFVREMAYNIINDPFSIQFEKRYAIAGLTAPTITKRYIDNPKLGVTSIKRYLEESKVNNFEGALDALDIKINEASIAELIKNMNEQERKMTLEEGR